MSVVMDRLSFGRAIPNGGEVTDADWAAFEASEIAPRFPLGFTVLHALGAWQDQDSLALIHEPSIILEVAHEVNSECEAAVRAIAARYKERFSQDAVMRTTQPIDCAFL